MSEQHPLKSVSDLLKGSWEQYKKHFNTLVPIMLVAGVGMYLQCLFLYLGSNDSVGVKVGNMAGRGMEVDGTFGILALVAAIIYLIGMIWGIAAIVNRVNKLDQPKTLGQSFAAAKPFIWPMIITGIMAGILTLIGFILVIIPGIIVAVWLSFSMYIVVVEGKSGADALKASKSYVEGYWWPVFGRLIVIGLIVGIIAVIAGNIGQALLGYKLGTLVQNIVSLILTPLAVLYQYALYMNVKSVKGGAGSMPVPAPTPAEA